MVSVIDLGTTNSLVAHFAAMGRPLGAGQRTGMKRLTPSAVAVCRGRHAARWAAPRQDRLIVSPQSGRAFFKRDMGTPTTILASAGRSVDARRMLRRWSCAR